MVDQSSDTKQQDEKPVASPHRHYVKFLLISFSGIVLLFSQLPNRSNAYINSRSVTVSSSLPGANVYQDIQFDSLATPVLGSIVLEYCENSPLLAFPCVAPVGMSTSAASLQFQSGDVGFSVHPLTATYPNKIILTRGAVASITGTKQYRLGNIVNPSVAGNTNYIRIQTYASVNGSGASSDFGAVAFSIQNPLTVSVYVPPYITLCSGVTVAVDCSVSTGSVVDIGELSKVASNSASTQFAVATNSYNGYSASVVGSTMTAGNRVIPALASPSFSIPGAGQFGINLRKNTIPNVGEDTAGIGSGTPSSSYNSSNIFQFQSGDIIASSPISTEWNRYTISYLVNVSNSQQAGRYASTLTVIATTTF